MLAMSDATHGQVAGSAADIYESFFVPALFGQWPDQLLAAADVRAGHDIADVGCGTGALAREAVGLIGKRGTVTGVDLNDAMLSVAGRSELPIEWHSAAAEDLPFEDDRFDRCLSQFALMFFSDRSSALREMARVTKPGGRIGLATWAAVDRSPGYAAMVALLEREVGFEAAEALRAPFCIGEPAQLGELVDPFLREVDVSERPGTARFESIDAWLHTDIRGWTLSEMIDDEGFAELLAAARIELARFVNDRGEVNFPAPALFAIGQPEK